MKKIYNDYINNNTSLDKYQKIGIILLTVVFSGIFGWIYEFIFYYFNDGKFSFQGGNFLPWINIYAYGALLIILTTKKFKKKPLLVFIISMLVTGLLEYFSGLAIYKIGNGLRYWDYNTEILNFGNIGGFVCLRSILAFGFSALLLMYVFLPTIVYLSKKMNRKSFLILSITLFSIIMIDEVYNLLSDFLNLPNANKIYKG